MAENKTQATTQSVSDFINAIAHPTRQADALALDKMFRQVTGWVPLMWGPSIIGYGSYHYTYNSGRSVDCLSTGGSPRKSNMSVYIMPGYADFSGILARLGKHKTGKSSLYLNKLDDVDMDVLADLVRAGLKDLNGKWPVQAT